MTEPTGQHHKPEDHEEKGSLAAELKAILDLIKNTDITEVEIEDGERKISVKRGQAVHYETGPRPVISAGEHPAEQPPESPVENYVKVTAPMVGTFYRATSPAEPPLVKEGEVIERGQVIGIIEAMKMMNEIESDHAGRVVRILVADGHPVEYGQPILELEPVEE